MDDEEFLRAFEACTLDEFHHRDHVRIGWLYVRGHPLLAAIAKFSDGLKKFAAAKDKPGLYHETITWIYLLLINERVQRDPGMVTWDEFAAANPDLLMGQPSFLDRYYRKETLDSDLATRVCAARQTPPSSFGLSADFHKYGGIRAPMHPAPRRCSSVKYARYSPSSRLAGRAPRRPRCVTVFMKGSTKPASPSAPRAAPASR